LVVADYAEFAGQRFLPLIGLVIKILAYSKQQTANSTTNPGMQQNIQWTTMSHLNLRIAGLQTKLNRSAFLSLLLAVSRRYKLMQVISGSI
jgi:hypothetical protein